MQNRLEYGIIEVPDLAPMAQTAEGIRTMQNGKKKRNRLGRLMLHALAMPLVFGGCVGGAGGKLTYQQISGDEAKALMESESDYIILDTRTDEEFNAEHIPGAILIPEYEITERAEAELPDKDRLILVYCRSGRRSKIASQLLVMLGYKNVKEFGGIIDWPYETVK